MKRERVGDGGWGIGFTDGEGEKRKEKGWGVGRNYPRGSFDFSLPFSKMAVPITI